jgi:hypothetical protein
VERKCNERLCQHGGRQVEGYGRLHHRDPNPPRYTNYHLKRTREEEIIRSPQKRLKNEGTTKTLLSFTKIRVHGNAAVLSLFLRDLIADDDEVLDQNYNLVMK